MSLIKDILVHVDPTPEGRWRTELAWQLAARFDAHLVGLHVDTADEELLFYYSEMVAGAIEALRRQAQSDAIKAEAMFRKGASADVSSEWRNIRGSIVPVVAAQARCTDLLIIGPGGTQNARRLAESVPISAGRPVLIMPRIEMATARLGRRIVIAWDGGREATRSVHDALPFLREAEAVYILSIGHHDGDGLPADRPSGDELARHLSRHGVQSEFMVRATQRQPTATVIDTVLREVGADLLVMGYYGHSRISELVLGGVTREFLNFSTVPVFGSH